MPLPGRRAGDRLLLNSPRTLLSDPVFNVTLKCGIICDYAVYIWSVFLIMEAINQNYQSARDKEFGDFVQERCI